MTTQTVLSTVAHPKVRPRTLLWLIAIWLFLLTLAALRPLSVPDEGRYAEISRWMLLSGDWLVPRIDGLPFFHKPPLMHWLQASIMAVLGPTPWAARLVPALAAALMLAGLYLGARRMAGEALAARAALMMAASLGFLLGGQYINHDMLVAAWIATAIWCFALAFVLSDGNRPHAGWARAGYVACALGVMTKGLIGLALPGLVIFVWLFATRQWRKVPRLPWISGLLLFALIAVPWFVLAGQRYPGLWSYLFGEQQFTRYTSAGFNNVHPWWFYLAGLLAMLFPWSLFVPFSVFTRADPSPEATRSQASDAHRALVKLCWIWLVAIVVFFSIPSSKLIGYVLPVLPPLALLAALGWQRVWSARRHADRWFAGLMLIPVLTAGGVTLGYDRVAGDKLAADTAAVLACHASPDDPIYVFDGYPLDLPFLARTNHPLIVLQDWADARAHDGDTWRRVLVDAGDFEPELAAHVLQPPSVMVEAAHSPHAWLLSPVRSFANPALVGWRPVYTGRGWRLFASSGAASPQHESAAGHRETLPGCKKIPQVNQILPSDTVRPTNQQRYGTRIPLVLAEDKP
ncbi:glycosyl transferase, family 39 [Alicycliphilus sp. B1]|nr:glycosyl transferase, family 39 [Alicycliphilus sp. B1]